MTVKKNELPEGIGSYLKAERHVATPEELAEHRDFTARSRRLKLEMRRELLEKYPDKYAGLTKAGSLVVGDSMADLIAKVAELGEARGGMAWEYLNTKPRARMVIR